MKCRIELFHPDRGTSVLEFHKDTISVGRSGSVGAAVDIDLEPDRRVSRHHGQFVFEKKTWWVEDLNSQNGIYIRDQKITGKTSIFPGSEIMIGSWHLVFHYSVTFQDNMILPPVAMEADAAEVRVMRESGHSLPLDYAERFAHLIELTVQDSKKVDLSSFLTTLTVALKKCLPFVKSVDMIRVPATPSVPVVFDHLSPPSSVPAPLSRTLAEEVMKSGKAFLLSDSDREAPQSASLNLSQVKAAMYVPLRASDSIEGILCISSTVPGAFQSHDLAFASTAAFIAATRICETRMRQELRERERALANVRPHFPEKLWRFFVNNGEAMKKRHDTDDASIMYICIKGLRELLEQNPSREIQEIINDYFDQLILVIHHLDGITQAFGCDEMAAYFGLPGPDSDLLSKAAYGAYEIQRKLRFWHDLHRGQGFERLIPSIGLHTGPVTHGFTGPPVRLRYLITGEPVATARALARHADPGQILMSEEFWKSAGSRVEAGPQGEHGVPLVSVKI
jgi:class 3 adenylate cyclase